MARDTVPTGQAHPATAGSRGTQQPHAPHPRLTAAQLTSLLVDNGFNSILHGQPIPPGKVELVPTASGLRFPAEGNPVALTFFGAYTPPWSAFFRNSLFGVFLPVQLNGAASGAGNLGITWLQRWHLDLRHEFSLSSFVEIDFPTAPGATGLGVVGEGLFAKVLGPGVLYLNALGQTATGGGPRGWGGVAGYKWMVTPRFALAADYVLVPARHQSATQHILEYSTEVIATRFLAIGVGGLVGLSRRDFTPSYGFGVVAIFVF